MLLCVIIDISLSEWMKDKGLQLGQSLSTALANRLLDELGLSPFMNDEPCDRYSGIYAGSVDGWNSEGTCVYKKKIFIKYILSVFISYSDFNCVWPA